MAILTMKSGPEPGRVIDLKPGFYRVGRLPQNDIHIPDPSVSSSHCEINVAEISVAIKDLGSTNGTFINQQRVAKGLLQTGDRLTLGAVDFEVKLPEVNIAIPDIPQPNPVFVAFLEDGSPACLNHQDLPAVFRCTKCETWFCADCVRVMKRLSGEFLNFCRECSAPCELIPREVAAKKSFFDRLGETLRLPRKR